MPAGCTTVTHAVKIDWLRLPSRIYTQFVSVSSIIYGIQEHYKYTMWYAVFCTYYRYAVVACCWRKCFL